MNIIKSGNERLGNFIKHIMYNPFPLENQRSFGEKEEMFLEDFFTIEMAKYFYIGEERYKSEPIPRRLVNTKSFNVELIIKECRELEERILKEKAALDSHKFLVISQVGRGLELLLLTEISNWEQISCFDEDNRYENFLDFFNKNVSFYKTEIEKFNFPEDEYVFKTKRLCK